MNFAIWMAPRGLLTSPRRVVDARAGERSAVFEKLLQTHRRPHLGPRVRLLSPNVLERVHDTSRNDDRHARIGNAPAPVDLEATRPAITVQRSS
jgi:hypothetical protein